MYLRRMRAAPSDVDEEVLVVFPPLESRSVCHPLTVGPLLTRPSGPQGEGGVGCSLNDSAVGQLYSLR